MSALTSFTFPPRSLVYATPISPAIDGCFEYAHGTRFRRDTSIEMRERFPSGRLRHALGHV